MKTIEIAGKDTTRKVYAYTLEELDNIFRFEVEQAGLKSYCSNMEPFTHGFNERFSANFRNRLIVEIDLYLTNTKRYSPSIETPEGEVREFEIEAELNWSSSVTNITTALTRVKFYEKIVTLGAALEAALSEVKFTIR